jgi:hypothetical protein
VEQLKVKALSLSPSTPPPAYTHTQKKDLLFVLVSHSDIGQTKNSPGPDSGWAFDRSHEELNLTSQIVFNNKGSVKPTFLKTNKQQLITYLQHTQMGAAP